MGEILESGTQLQKVTIGRQLVEKRIRENLPKLKVKIVQKGGGGSELQN